MKHFTLLLMTFVLFSKINAKEHLSSSLEKSNINLVNDAELQSKAKKNESTKPYSYQNRSDSVFKYRPQISKFKVDLTGEFLYWKLSEEEVDFALTNARDDGSTEAIGKLATAKFDWQPAFRVGMSVNFPSDYFEIIAKYTYFSPSGKDSHTFEPTPILFTSDLLSTFVEHTDTRIRKAKSDIRFYLQEGDLLIGRRFQLSDNFLAKFEFGPCITYLEQKWKINFFPRIIENKEPVLNPVRENWRFFGGGLKIGSNFDFFLGKGFSMLAQASTSLNYGQYKNRFTNKKGEITKSDAKLTDHHIVNNLQLAFGPSWGKQFSNWGIIINASYELGIWYNLHKVMRSLEDTFGNGRPSMHASGPLSIQGFTGSATVNF